MLIALNATRGRAKLFPVLQRSTFATRRPRLLLDRGDDVLGSLGYAELNHGLGLDLDRRAGLRVAANAGLALCLDEAADARDDEYPVLLGLLDGRFGECVEEGADLLVGEFQLLRHHADQGCLGQSSCHFVFPPMFCAYARIRVAWETPVWVVPAEELRLDKMDNVCANLQC